MNAEIPSRKNGEPPPNRRSGVEANQQTHFMANPSTNLNTAFPTDFSTDISPKHPLGPARSHSITRHQWLGQRLYPLNDHDWWQVRDAVEGTGVFGATGSGKTSASGMALATSMLRKGFGGIVLTAKADDLDTWHDYFRAAGVSPEERLVVLSPNCPFRFNALGYEYLLNGLDQRQGDTRRLVSLFMTTLGTGEGEVSRTDPYWTDTLRELVTHAVDLVAFATGSAENGQFVPPSASTGVQLADIAEVVRTAPKSAKEAKSHKWLRDSRCGDMLVAADNVHWLLSANDHRREDLKDTVHYWLHTFPTLSDRTRSVIETSFTSKANELLRYPLRELFCTTTSPQVTPEATYRGKVVLLNLPVKQYGEAGRLAQVLYKTVWQHTTETSRRWLEGADQWRPVFLWADEAQHFVTMEDMLFQATARSQLAATVYLTQNISNYYHALGGSRSSATDSLLGSLQMKIFHANGDPATNEWAERLFGTDSFRHTSPSSSTSSRSQVQFSISQQDAREPIFPASEFTRLRRGGGKELTSDAVIFHAGRRWGGESSNKNFLVHRFRQVSSM